MVIFWALRATLVHFADFVTGHGTSCAPCAVCHTPGALCTFICAYSMTIQVRHSPRLTGADNIPVALVQLPIIKMLLPSRSDI